MPSLNPTNEFKDDPSPTVAAQPTHHGQVPNNGKQWLKFGNIDCSVKKTKKTCTKESSVGCIWDRDECATIVHGSYE